MKRARSQSSPSETVTRRKAENLLGAASLAIQDLVGTALKALDLRTDTDAATLVLLQQANHLSIKAMAALLDLEHSSMVRAVDRLVARRLVTRTANPVDSRQAVLILTAEGIQLAGRVLEARRATLDGLLGDLNSGEISALTDLLSTILAKHTSGRGSADRLCRLCDEQSCGGDRCPVERAAVAQLVSGAASCS